MWFVLSEISKLHRTKYPRVDSTIALMEHHMVFNLLKVAQMFIDTPQKYHTNFGMWNGIRDRTVILGHCGKREFITN